jgi:hypothetical protein
VSESDVAQFAREWNFAFGLVVAVDALLFVNGRLWLGSIAIGLGVAAFVLRRRAMRREGRGFYGQKK